MGICPSRGRVDGEACACAPPRQRRERRRDGEALGSRAADESAAEGAAEEEGSLARTPRACGSPPRASFVTAADVLREIHGGPGGALHEGRPSASPSAPFVSPSRTAKTRGGGSTEQPRESPPSAGDTTESDGPSPPHAAATPSSFTPPERRRLVGLRGLPATSRAIVSSGTRHRRESLLRKHGGSKDLLSGERVGAETETETEARRKAAVADHVGRLSIARPSGEAGSPNVVDGVLHVDSHACFADTTPTRTAGSVRSSPSVHSPIHLVCGSSRSGMPHGGSSVPRPEVPPSIKSVRRKGTPGFALKKRETSLDIEEGMTSAGSVDPFSGDIESHPIRDESAWKTSRSTGAFKTTRKTWFANAPAVKIGADAHEGDGVHVDGTCEDAAEESYAGVCRKLDLEEIATEDEETSSAHVFGPKPPSRR